MPYGTEQALISQRHIHKKYGGWKRRLWGDFGKNFLPTVSFSLPRAKSNRKIAYFSGPRYSPGWDADGFWKMNLRKKLDTRAFCCDFLFPHS